eukprot:TRINITY_DN66815_c6_g9_i2.p1 TRINITY_DN66815_c6_g9~~TRINITY_DN66815_c6_g9_i2.p1  ORF type:complete len:525 (-),score=267.56 TRINITY_DN66815_c6_g9_i2:461-1987(-)
MSKRFSRAEVARHDSETDCWVIIDDSVYDLTSFAKFHPGGRRVILAVAGQDVSEQFHALHNSVRLLHKYNPRLRIGKLVDSDNYSGKGKKQQSSVAVVGEEEKSEFGAMVPFGDPYWYQGYRSPYYNESHARFRAKVRAFVDKELMPHVHTWDEQGTYPPDLHERAYKAGIYGAIWPREFGGTPPEQFDAFHDLILVDELSRCAAGGVLWACFFSFGIALPPVLSVGSDFLKSKVARDVITGKKIMSLAVTEPYAGSDVANLRTTARREGDFFIVNGQKKFITSGMQADYLTVAVRTGGKGMMGISLLLIDRHAPGVTCRRMKTQGWWSSSTTFINFEDVRVPVNRLIGKLNQGFLAIMLNFNHERFLGVIACNRYARVCLEESIKYARLRKTFGRRLISHQVIRHKLIDMARQIEANQAMTDFLAFQMDKGVDPIKLGGLIAMLKVQATRTYEYCAREASQVFGGNSFVRGGKGEKVERLYREVRVNAIGGGSEEILLDLAMKMSKL